MNHNWRKTPARAYLRCLAVALHDTGLRGDALLARFREIVPNWKREFDGPISDNAVVQRADKGRRYESEWPETSPATAPHWRRAVRDARSGRCTFDFGGGQAAARKPGRLRNPALAAPVPGGAKGRGRAADAPRTSPAPRRGQAGRGRAASRPGFGVS